MDIVAVNSASNSITWFANRGGNVSSWTANTMGGASPLTAPMGVTVADSTCCVVWMQGCSLVYVTVEKRDLWWVYDAVYARVGVTFVSENER